MVPSTLSEKFPKLTASQKAEAEIQFTQKPRAPFPEFAKLLIAHSIDCLDGAQNLGKIFDSPLSPFFRIQPGGQVSVAFSKSSLDNFFKGRWKSCLARENKVSVGRNSDCTSSNACQLLSYIFSCNRKIR